MTNTVNFHIIIHFNTLIYCQFIMAHNMHNNTRNKILKVFLKKEVTSHYPALSETDSTIKQVIMILNSTNIMGGTIMKLKKKAKKGFTLIELLIVVAIIAILAAIAIPQFAQYRIRGYNAAANSDMRNTKIGLEAFKTDWSVYPSTLACDSAGAGCTGAAGVGVTVMGPRTVTISIAAAGIKSPAPSTATQYSFGISSGVGMNISTDTNAVSYVMLTAHTSGDEIFGGDSDNTSIKHSGKDSAGAATALTVKVAGGQLAAGGVTAVSASDDLIPTTTWSAM